MIPRVFYRTSLLLGLSAAWMVTPAPRLGKLLGRAFPRVTFDVPTKRPRIAITIDDSPSSITNELLEILAAHNAHATFFAIGERAKTHPELMQRIIEQGHELGNHGWRDIPATILSPKELRDSVSWTAEVLNNYGSVSWFRPGGGVFSHDIYEEAKHQGYRCALGSVYAWDHFLPSPGFASWYIERSAYPGAIVILHDGEFRGRRTATTLRQVLPRLAQKGFEFVTLSDLVSDSVKHSH